MTTHDQAPIAVTADPSGDQTLRRQSHALAVRLSIPWIAQAQDRDVEMILALTAKRLELRIIGGDPSLKSGRPFYIDWSRMDVQSSNGRRLTQPLAKAVGIKKGSPDRPTIIDATAGLGADAWLLASLGCQVVAVERHPVVAALLDDALRRAADHNLDIASRIQLSPGDSTAILPTLEKPDVVYLDPMFPTARKTLQKKAMRVLRRLAGEDGDSQDLFSQALCCAKRRVVVKRPTKAPALGSAKPTISHPARGLRYDVYAMTERRA